MNGLPAPKHVFKREGKLEINPLLLQAFGITADELAETIRAAEEPESMRDMFAFLSDYATLSDPKTRMLISGDRLDFLVADMKRRMGDVARFYINQADEYEETDPDTAKKLLQVANKAIQLYNFKGQSRLDKIDFIDAVVHFGHTTGPMLPVAFGISDYGREEYWVIKLLAFLRTHGMPGMVKENIALKGNYSEGKSMFIREETGNGFRANPNLINKQAARIAHAGTSFEPEKRGEQAINSFAEEVQSIYERLKPHAKTGAEKALLLNEMERFQAAYAQKFNDLLYSHSRIYSTMIAGRSNFPAERMRKINDAYDNKAEETRDWVKRAERAMLRALKGLATEEAGGEAAVLKQKIEDAERNHEFMVKTNVIVRKNIPDDQKIREIMALAPISEATAREVLKPDFIGRIGFPAYALSNDTANIRRMKEHLIELEKREATPTGEITFAGGSIVDNREADRVQIFFDQKPPQDMINRLRSEGWHWSPHMGAWMRKRTQAAMYSAARITGAVLPATPAPAPAPPVAVIPAPVPVPAPVAVTPPVVPPAPAPRVSPAPVNVPWPTEKPEQKKFVQQTFKIEERMRRGYGYGRYGYV